MIKVTRKGNHVFLLVLMVYVDSLHYWPSRSTSAYAVGKRHGHMWCHLWADTVDELIEFAMTLGLRRAWLQQGNICKHFDLVPPYRERAIANGAVEMSLAEWYRNRRKNAVGYEIYRPPLKHKIGVMLS